MHFYLNQLYNHLKYKITTKNKNEQKHSYLLLQTLHSIT